MIDKSVAETKWCPQALVQSEVKECAFDGEWEDNSSSYLQVSSLKTLYKTDGKVIAVTVINRTASGEKHADCLCITDKCQQWRRLSSNSGFCSIYGDNMNRIVSGLPDDTGMKVRWCLWARPENEVVTRPWNGDISGCTNAISSANRVAGNAMHPSSKCITTECMAYYAHRADGGTCNAGDKSMQGY